MSRGGARSCSSIWQQNSLFIFFFSSRRRHTRFKCDWSSDVCSSDLPAPSLGIFEATFNGTITNDKFCMSRMGRLQLTWWRLPLRARLPVSNQTGYPTDVNAMECCHQEGTHEETQVQHQPSQERDGRCATPVGSSLPVSCPMEQRIP